VSGCDVATLNFPFWATGDAEYFRYRNGNTLTEAPDSCTERVGEMQLSRAIRDSKDLAQRAKVLLLTRTHLAGSGTAYENRGTDCWTCSTNNEVHLHHRLRITLDFSSGFQPAFEGGNRGSG
jgi:hypothetical protein